MENLETSSECVPALSNGLQSTTSTTIPISPLLISYIDVFSSYVQSLDEEQTPHWSSIQKASSWTFMPLSAAHNATYLNNTHLYHQSIETFRDLLQYEHRREVKHEWAPAIDPCYSMEEPSLNNSLLKRSSPATYKEMLRTRQRGYEKVYRKKKRVEFKHMRGEWIQLEMMHRRLREQKHSHPAAYLHKETPSKLEKLHQLQMEERALRRDLVSLQSLKAWYDISIVRLPMDKEGALLRTTHEWETVSDCLLGMSATAPFAPIMQTFSW